MRVGSLVKTKFIIEIGHNGMIIGKIEKGAIGMIMYKTQAQRSLHPIQLRRELVAHHRRIRNFIKLILDKPSSI